MRWIRSLTILITAIAAFESFLLAFLLLPDIALFRAQCYDTLASAFLVEQLLQCTASLFTFVDNASAFKRLTAISFAFATIMALT